MNTKKTAGLIITVVLIAASLAYVFANQSPQNFHGIGVLKSADPFAYVGDMVTYVIKVFNPSDVDLHDINVTDMMLDLNETIPFMAAGNTTGVTYALQREVLETDPNPLINTVTVEALDEEGAYSTASTQAMTTIAQRLIDIQKTGPEFAHEGDHVKYSIVITNLADSPIANATVNDEMLGFSWKGDLAVEEINVFNLTYVVPADAEDPLTNTATVFAKLDETVIYDEDSWTVDILHPELEVMKTADPSKVWAGENVTYTIVVTNTGDTTLFNMTLIDSIYGDAPTALIPSSLATGESFVWSFNASVSTCVVNKATATGVDALGMKVTARDKAFVEAKPKFVPRSMGYWKNHPAAWPVNEIEIGNVTYSKEQALEMLNQANARDATRMLAAQLIAAKLNRLSEASPFFKYFNQLTNIDDVIENTDAFLAAHPLGSDPQGDARQQALQLKDMLDAYNNSGECD